jgi:predicted LPLAT superfamily acyltransferase
MKKLWHLVKRAVTSFSNDPISGADVERVERLLLLPEFELWWTMQPRDQRHSLQVHERFMRFYPPAKRTEQAAALLHDIGKTVSGLGWFMRIIATLVGSRGIRFAMYHDHENLGAQMLQGISEQRTLDLVGGSVDDVVMVALRNADNI